MHIIVSRFLACLLLFTATGCQSAQQSSSAAADTITVEGSVVMRGHGPSIEYMGEGQQEEAPADDSARRAGNDALDTSALVLETDSGALYVLVMADAEERELQNEAPGRYRVTGSLYEDTWRGESFAHLRVIEWVEI